MAAATMALLAVTGINYGAGLVGWLIIGAIAGALAGRVMSGGGFGILGDVVIGIIGAIIGGFLLSLFNASSDSLIVTLITAFIGACILLAVIHTVTGNRAKA